MAWNLWILGYPTHALARAQEALSWAQELSHPHTLAWALDFLTLVHGFRREWQVVQEQIGEAISLSTEQGFPLWLANATFKRGKALAEQGSGEEGIVQMCQGIATYRRMGQGGLINFLALLAETYSKVGQPEQGLGLLIEALAMVHKNRERWCEAELYRLKGKLILQLESQSSESLPREAEVCFLKAVEIARQQQTKSWELRASTSLARLWQQYGKQKEAHNLLSDVYNWFTEGFDTKDLQEAQTLLEEL
jgi:predicted ATPase